MNYGDLPLFLFHSCFLHILSQNANGQMRTIGVSKCNTHKWRGTLHRKNYTYVMYNQYILMVHAYLSSLNLSQYLRAVQYS